MSERISGLPKIAVVVLAMSLALGVAGGAWAKAKPKPASNLLTPTDHALILIDHQPQMAFATKSIDIVELRNNVTGLAKSARLFDVPTILTTVAEESFSGPIFPEIQAVFKDGLDSLDRDRELLLRGLQTQGIWLQLLNIAEENAFTRERRRVEVLAGPDEVVGSFDRVLARAAAAGVEAEAVRRVLAEARIRPVITAHPTEAKRVTVLEIHRRIYRLLVELESDRWTPREREALVRDLGNEIDLLWLTGEIRLERPKVEQEVADVMRGDAVVDCRNLLDPDEVKAAGLTYDGVGRR